MAKFTTFLLTFIFAIFALSSAAFAAVFVKFDGIDDESSKKGDGWIEIESFSHGIGQGAQSATGATRRRAMAAPYDVTLIKPVDAASPKILEAATRGKVFPTVTVKYEQNSKTYISTMSNVQITSVEQKGAGEHWPKEHVSFTYQKITWEYGNGGDKVTAAWDFKTGR